MRGTLALLFEAVTQNELGGHENIRVETFSKNLALHFYPPKISARADVLHQVLDFREGTPPAIRRKVGVTDWLCGFCAPPSWCLR
jgi:hypothetical protein